MKVNFHAMFRQVVGGKTVELPHAKRLTVRQLIDAMVQRYPPLREELLDEQGQLHGHVHVFVSGRDVPFLPEGMATVLQPDDTIDIFPPVGGG